MYLYSVNTVTSDRSIEGGAYYAHGTEQNQFAATCFWNALSFPWPDYFGPQPRSVLSNFHFVARDPRNNEHTRIYKWGGTWLKVKRVEVPS